MTEWRRMNKDSGQTVADVLGPEPSKRHELADCCRKRSTAKGADFGQETMGAAIREGRSRNIAHPAASPRD